MLLTYASAALAAGAALSLLCLWLAFDHVRARRLAQTRIARFGIAPAETVEEPAAVASPGTLLRQLGLVVARRSPPEQLRELDLRLLRAGVRGRPSVEEFLGLRVLAAIGGLVLGAAIAVPLASALDAGSPGTGVAILLLAIATGGALGLYLPLLVLDRLCEQRRNTIERLLPNTVDVLTVSLDAGVGFDTAITFLCERGDDPLTIELRRYLADLRLGRSRREALDALVNRTQMVSMREFAAAMIQADELGTGLARTLQTQASAVRAMRRVHAEERARKAPIRLLFPIVLCILPVLFIVIVGPSLIRTLAIVGR